MNRWLVPRGWRWLAFALAVLAATACRPDASIKVAIETEPDPTPGSNSIAVRARVVGLENGVTYKWFSVHGQCVPQESDSPASTFKFGVGSVSDRVSLGVWHLGQLVAQSHVDVRLENGESLPPELQPAGIEMTDMPPFDPVGLVSVRHHISGKAMGKVEDDAKVVIYCRQNNQAWQVQPNIYETHPLHSDRTWSTWTHGGTSYGVLLVRSDYAALDQIGALPPVGGGVLARLILEGERKP